MGVTKVLKVLSGEGTDNEPDIEWYHVASPADLHLHVPPLYCTATFFDGCIGRITSKLRGEAKPTILEQWDCVSSLEFFCESLDWSFESFASLRHLFRLVESWPERTKLRTRANSLSFPPRPLLASCFRHVCHVIELGRYSRMPLFKQCSCLLRFTWHFIIHSKYFPNSDWLKAHP